MPTIQEPNVESSSTIDVEQQQWQQKESSDQSDQNDKQQQASRRSGSVSSGLAALAKRRSLLMSKVRRVCVNVFASDLQYATDSVIELWR